MYYLVLVLVWMFSIVFTIECSLKMGDYGLIIGISFSIFILACGVLFVRACLETMLSVDVIRQSFDKKTGINVKEFDVQDSLIENESADEASYVDEDNSKNSQSRSKSQIESQISQTQQSEEEEEEEF